MRYYWTEADLAELPQDGTRHEIIDGRLYETPPGEFGLLATLKPGEPHDVLWPFPLTLDPAKLRSA